MSTLLKKKYLYGRCRPLECDEQDVAVTAAAVDTCNSDTTSDVSCSRKRKLEAAVAAEPTERPGAPRKVSFKELVTIIVPSKAENGVHPPLDAEMLQEYRNDIWYSVRTVEVMLVWTKQAQ
jgi:hypothetical protein